MTMTMTMTKTMTMTMTLVACLSVWGTARASGISVSPGEVRIQTERGKAKGEMIRVKNPTARVSLVNVYPDELEDIIRAMPSSFILEGGEEREVVINARPKEEGAAMTTLSVRAEALGKEKLKGAAGVKIPVRVEVRASLPYVAILAQAFKKEGIGILLFAILLVMGGAIMLRGIQEIKKQS